MTKTILILAIAAAFVAGTITTTGLVYAHGGNVNLIHACVGKQLGFIRIVSPTTTCTQLENPLDWNIQGVQGPQGEQGIQGIQGPPGTSNMKHVTLEDGECFFDETISTQAIGWCPHQEEIDTTSTFIEDPHVTENSVIHLTANLEGSGCDVRTIFVQPPHTGFLTIGCNADDGSNLNYVIINP